MSTSPKVKQSLIEKYYQVVRSAYNIYAIDKQNMGFAEFQKMHKVASVAMTYLLNKCVVRYMEDGERKYKWNVMVKPSIEIAQEMANKSRLYNKESAERRKSKITQNEPNSEWMIENSKQSYIESQYPTYRRVKNKAGGFGMLTNKLKTSFDNIGIELPEGVSYKDIARLFFKENKIILKTVFEDVKKYSPRYKNKKNKTNNKFKYEDAVLDNLDLKGTGYRWINSTTNNKTDKVKKINLNDSDIKSNQSIINNKNNIEDNLAKQ